MNYGEFGGQYVQFLWVLKIQENNLAIYRE